MIAVCIIGESATRNRWSLNGYSKPTTPRMDSRRQELCIFTNLLASAANTAEALRFLLTEATKASPDKMNCTLPQMLASAGVQSVLLSNHGRWGSLDGTETFLFSGCRRLLFLSEEGLAKPWHDDALLPFLDTDVLLDRVIRRLQSLNRPTMMVYLSDHGESVNSSSIRNAADASTWEIPMICWFSAEFRSQHPGTVRRTEEQQSLPWTTDRLLPLLLRLFRVDGYES